MFQVIGLFFLTLGIGFPSHLVHLPPTSVQKVTLHVQEKVNACHHDWVMLPVLLYCTYCASTSANTHPMWLSDLRHTMRRPISHCNP